MDSTNGQVEGIGYILTVASATAISLERLPRKNLLDAWQTSLSLGDRGGEKKYEN